MMLAAVARVGLVRNRGASSVSGGIVAFEYVEAPLRERLLTAAETGQKRE